jgi:uncharacterized membrane protein YagU involved in acid resistance
MKLRSGLWAVLAGGTLAGALDILFAISFAASSGVAPSRLLQSVASGWLGNAAFTGGLSTAVLGLASHFALSYIWATLFFAAAARFSLLVRRPLLSGMVFGIVVFLCMRLVVLPLSAFPSTVTFKPLATVLDLASHMFLFGFPITWAASRVMAQRPNNSFKPKPLRGSD